MIRILKLAHERKKMLKEDLESSLVNINTTFIEMKNSEPYLYASHLYKLKDNLIDYRDNQDKMKNLGVKDSELQREGKKILTRIYRHLQVHDEVTKD